MLQVPQDWWGLRKTKTASSYLTALSFLQAGKLLVFSRLASKPSLEHQEVNQSDDAEQIRAENESQLQAMSKKVMSEISIQHAHPILYNDYSICELVKNSKL